MSRRSGTSMQVLLATAIVGLFVYGLYSHHDIQTRLKKSEEKGERLRQQHDSLSAQLQVVYEHKSRLEKSLQSEKTDHRKSRTDLLQQQSEVQSKFENDKQELLNRINSLTQEHRMMKSQHEDLQVEVVKVKEDKQKLEEDHKKLLEQHNTEFQQMQQEKTNEIAQYRDQVANLQRKNEDLENRMAVAVQNYQLNQNDLQKAMNYVDRLQTRNKALEAEIQRQKLLLEQQHQPQQQQQPQQQNQQQQGLVQQQQNQNQQIQQQLPNNQQQLQYQQQQLQQQQQQQQPQGQQVNFGANQMQQKQPDQQIPQVQQEGQFNQGQQANNDLQYNQGQANVVNNRQIPQNVQSQFNQGNQQGNQLGTQGNQQGNQGNQLGNLGVQDMAIQHQNMGLQQQPQVNADQQQQQQIPQQQGLQQQQQQGVQQQQQPNLQAGAEGQKDPQDGQGQGQGQNGAGQEQAMQIKMPGDSQHPGYHEIKKPDPPQEGQLNVGQGHQEDSRGDAGRAPAQVDAEHKDVQFQQVAAPNMSPEKNQSLSNNTQQGRGLLHRLRRGISATDNTEHGMKQRGLGHLEGPIGHQGQIPDNGHGHALAVNAPDNGKDVKVVNSETGQNMVRTAVKSPEKEDQDKAMEEHDTIEDEAKLAGHKAEPDNQQNVPRIHRGGLNQANPLENHFEGGMGGDGAGRDVIQAPVNPVQDGEVGHGQVERPNVVPPMVNNNQENQVPLPQAPQLRDNEILKNGQQVNDDDDYDNGRNNDNKPQQDDQEDQEDDDNYPADKAKK